MTGSKAPPPAGGPPDDDKKPEDGKSGRVTFDERGNAVWEWSMSTGIFGRNVDTKRLKKLEAHDLKIEDDPTKLPKVPLSVEPPPRAPGGGSDPYNSSGTGVAGGPKRPARPAQKPKDLKRLSEWIQLQKTMGKKPDKE